MLLLRTSQVDSRKVEETGMAEHEHGSHHLDDAENWQEDIGSHCTDYLQMAFISACLSIFVGGIIVIMIFRITESFIRYAFYKCPYESKVSLQINGVKGGTRHDK